MIPATIIWLIRRYYLKKNIKNQKLNLRQMRGQFPKFIAILLLLLLLIVSIDGNSQNHSLTYAIVRNGNKVGIVRFTQTTYGDKSYLHLESEVKTRFIFTFTARAKEEAVYSKGVLLHSSIYRQMNGNEKANKQHQAIDYQYIIRAGKKTAVVRRFPITYSMLSLYTSEPMNLAEVYSDNFETFLAIEKMEPHKYKITLPDGNYNYYYYKDGLLKLIEVHHSLYSANIVLTN